MKRFFRHRTLVALGAMLLLGTVAMAQPKLHDLDIRVELRQDGSGHITETRHMTIDDQFTECYIGMANTAGAKVSNLNVTDEKGTSYRNVGAWNTDRTRAEKAGQCGIVEKGDGFEICWGLGDSGERTYVTTYDLTGLVRSYGDADGMRHVFIDQGVKPKPEHARITIVRADGTPITPGSDTRAWAFRFKDGEVAFKDGTLVVETTEAMTPKNALYVMVRFGKGMFQPTIDTSLNFEQKRQEAFEGSDYYLDKEEAKSLLGKIWHWCLIVLGGLFGLGIIYLIVSAIREPSGKKDPPSSAIAGLLDNVNWYRDIPLNGDLRMALGLMNQNGDKGYLLFASLMKLVSMGTLRIGQKQGADGKMSLCIVVGELPDSDNQPVWLSRLHKVLVLAAGDNKEVTSDGLGTFVKNPKNYDLMVLLHNGLLPKMNNVNLATDEKMRKELRHVYGLKKFLEDFTLLNERHATEVALWKEYMVWAAFFGIAEQVGKDMWKLNPNFFFMDIVGEKQIDRQLLQEKMLRDLQNMQMRLSRDMQNVVAPERPSSSDDERKRSEGWGGRSSEGGGGGGFYGEDGGGGLR